MSATDPQKREERNLHALLSEEAIEAAASALDRSVNGSRAGSEPCLRHWREKARLAIGEAMAASGSSGADLNELMAELHFATDQQQALLKALKQIRDEHQDMWALQGMARQALLDHYARSEQRVKDLEDSGRYS